MPKVPTTFSFATSPVIVATADFQSPQPSGAKIHAMPLQIIERKPSLKSSTMPKRPSAKPKLEVNQMKMVDSRMMVPAFLMKDQPRSHMLLSTFPTVGI